MCVIPVRVTLQSTKECTFTLQSSQDSAWEQEIKQSEYINLVTLLVL